MALTSPLLLCAAATAFAVPVYASVNISTAPTQNMACSAGVCTPTAKRATLNAGDLENLLASSDVTVNTGSGAVTIGIAAPLAWTSTHRLTLDADLNVNVKAQVAVEGAGGLTIINGSGGEFLFVPGGKVDFWDTSASLVVNGNSYALVSDLASLAAAVAANPAGFFALAKDYDAGPDGTYTDTAVPTEFTGTFEGLGHTVANFSVASGINHQVGLFSLAGASAALRDIRLENASLTSGAGARAGLLAGEVDGSIESASSGGTVVTGDRSVVGGLVGVSSGGITRSFSTASVTAGKRVLAGGLVGEGKAISYSHASGNILLAHSGTVGGLAGFVEGGPIAQSYATGNIATTGKDNKEYMGGLIGVADEESSVADCYATGSVQAGGKSDLGGLIGFGLRNAIGTSYSVGKVTVIDGARHNSRYGGFIGDSFAEELDSDYWDADTSGFENACGQNGSGCAAVTGLSDGEFRSALPSGFDAAIWAQSASINNGYPYLIANPPQ
jgi:hypothetical protein